MPTSNPRGCFKSSCRISSEMRHGKNSKDSSNQGWRKGEIISFATGFLESEKQTFKIFVIWNGFPPD
jgi:hypothetical protein